MSKLITWLAGAALALAAPHAATAGPTQDARVHIDRATLAHKAGDLDKALSELQAAYAIAPKPQLLYALGQIYTKLGRCPEASGVYRRFLASGSNRRTAQVVKQAIESCKPRTEPAAPPPPPPPSPPSPLDREEPPPPPARAKITPPPPRRLAMAPRPAPPSPPPPPRSTARSPWYRDAVGDVLVVGGVASAVLGVLAYRVAVTDLDTAETVSSHDRYTEIVDGAHTKRLYAVALVGGGVALAGAGVLLFMLRDRSTEVRRVGMVPARGGGLFTWTRSF